MKIQPINENKPTQTPSHELTAQNKNVNANLNYLKATKLDYFKQNKKY